MDASRQNEPTRRVDATEKTASLIMVGLDGGAASLRAAAFAVGIAARQRADLLFVQVWEQPTSYGLVPELLPLDDATIAAAHPVLCAAITDLVGDLGLRWQLRQAIGRPSIELARVSHEVRADTVIVGSSRRWVRRLRGSIGSDLVRAQRCPVTVVP